MLKTIKNWMRDYQNSTESEDTPLPVLLFFRYLNDDVGMKSAALSYYLIFSIFPMLILLSMIIGSLHLDIASLSGTLHRILPADIVSLLSSYLKYVTDSYSSTLLTFALIFSVYFPWRFVRSLMDSIRYAFRLNAKQPILKSLIRQLICTLLIPVTIVLCLILIIFGQNVIRWFCSFLLPGTIRLSNLLLNLWQYLRFGAAALIMGISLGILYELSMDHRLRFRKILPGILFSILAWIITSVIFSFYVENFANYSVIYGAIGGFMVLLLWLYLSSLIFIMGSELNALLLRNSQKKKQPLLAADSVKTS